MVLDTSAIVAILLDEPEALAFARKIEAAEEKLISAATLLEASIVIESRKGEPGGRELDLFLYRSRAQIVPVDSEQAEIARLAWRRYGKGRHPASLNFGDCFAYALARTTGKPILFKGNDFTQTDVSQVTIPSHQ